MKSTLTIFVVFLMIIIIAGLLTGCGDYKTETEWKSFSNKLFKNDKELALVCYDIGYQSAMNRKPIEENRNKILQIFEEEK